VARQFMLGVVQTAEGMPIYHEVFDGNHEFDTKRVKCLISLETAQKFPLQQAQLRIRHGLSDVHRRQQVSLLSMDIGDA
jgi:hypothetical protein